MNLVKQNISFLIPELINFLGEINFDWNTINKQFDKKIESIIDFEDNEIINLESSIFFQIISIKKGNKDYVGMFLYYNQLFKSLNTLLDYDEKKLIIKNIQHLLNSFDIKYLNYLGELSVLNKLKVSKNFKLIGTEKKLSNGKSIDFDFEIIDTKMRVLIEVVNIHINTSKVEKDMEQIGIFFNNRIFNKFEDKKKGLSEDLNIHLVVVLWGKIEDLKIYKDYFTNYSLDNTLTYEPLSFLNFKDEYGNYEHRFSSLSCLFD